MWNSLILCHRQDCAVYISSYVCVRVCVYVFCTQDGWVRRKAQRGRALMEFPSAQDCWRGLQRQRVQGGVRLHSTFAVEPTNCQSRAQPSSSLTNRNEYQGIIHVAFSVTLYRVNFEPAYHRSWKQSGSTMKRTRRVTVAHVVSLFGMDLAFLPRILALVSGKVLLFVLAVILTTGMFSSTATLTSTG